MNCSTRHHARRSPSTGSHTHASHSHASTPGGSPLHTPNFVGLLSPHRAVPSSHHGQTGSPHRLSSVGSTGGNGSSPQGIPTPIPPLASVGIELSEVQPGMIKNNLLVSILLFLKYLSIFVS